jgi:hypothetical protein
LGEPVHELGADLGPHVCSPGPTVVVDLDAEGVEEPAQPVDGQVVQIDGRDR